MKITTGRTEILIYTSSNMSLSPIIEWTPISLKNLGHLFQHLPTFTVKKRDDHIFGVTWNLANTLGIIIIDTNTSDLIDQPMTLTEKKQMWRAATFHCKWNNDLIKLLNYGVQNFCKSYSLLIFNEWALLTMFCPSCNINKSWIGDGQPCLACLFSEIIYRNPLKHRLQQQLEKWLCHDDTGESVEESMIPNRQTRHIDT